MLATKTLCLLLTSMKGYFYCFFLALHCKGERIQGKEQ